MIAYYAKRAGEYDEVYNRNDKKRNEALKKMGDTIQAFLKNKDVLELACGTGYWTKLLSETAQSILATDVNKEVIEFAKKRHFNCPVSFEKEDVYALSFEKSEFSGGMANFLFSHIPKSRIGEFLNKFHKALLPGARVFIADDMLLPLDNPIKKLGDENTYSERSLADGSKHLILKNFFTKDDLVNIFKLYVPDFTEKNIYVDNYFWYVTYELENRK